MEEGYDTIDHADDVMNVVEKAGLEKIVAQLKPVGVVKG